MKEITLEAIKNTEGVNGINVWEKGSVKRYYINIGQASAKAWWQEDGKLYVQDAKGRNSTEANETLKRLIGCNYSDRYSSKNEYVIIK